MYMYTPVNPSFTIKSGLNDHKEPENKDNAVVKYGETFYGHDTTLTPAVGGEDK